MAVEYKIFRRGDAIVIEMPLEAIRETATERGLVICNDNDLLDDLVEMLDESDGVQELVGAELDENCDRRLSVSQQPIGPIAAMLVVGITVAALMMPAAAPMLT